MRFEGIHHVTCITGDAPGNVDFYTRVLGLRHGQEDRQPGRPDRLPPVLRRRGRQPRRGHHLLRVPGRPPRPGRRRAWCTRSRFRVGSEDALDFWEARLAAEGIATRRSEGRLGFDDPEGLGLELAVVATGDAPLVARHPEIPAEHALQGFDGVRAFASAPESEPRAPGEARSASPRPASTCGRRAAPFAAVSTPTTRRRPPAPASRAPGTVHHVAWASNMDEQDAWLATVRGAGAHASGVIDRFWFRSIYFREPSGVLFEIATMGPGFAIDEDADHLGESLILPPAFEHLRARDRAGADAAARPARLVGEVMTEALRHLERPAAGRAGGRPRAPARPRGRRARPLPAARRARPRAAAARDHAARARSRCRPAAPTGTGSAASPRPIRAPSSPPSRPLAAFLDAPAGADRARRPRRLLAGCRDELGARARRGPAAAGRDHRAVRASCRRWRASSST